MKKYLSTVFLLLSGVAAVLLLPAATFLCATDTTLTFVPMGGVRVIETLMGMPQQLPVGCTDTHALVDLSVHLLLIGALLAHFLTALLLKIFVRDIDPSLPFSRDYGALIIGTVLKTAMAAVGVAAVIGAILQIHSISEGLAENTTFQSPVQTVLFFGLLAGIFTVILCAWSEDRFAFWDAALFAAEIYALFYEVTLMVFHIDIILVLLSLPFPAFAAHFNPFFPEQWQTWLKDVKK